MQRILILLMRKLPYFLSKTRHLEASECTFHCSSYWGLCLALVFGAFELAAIHFCLSVIIDE